MGPKSTISARAPPGGCTTMKPMPPRPLFHGSRTASAKAAATTASTADPPAANISAPTVAAAPRYWRSEEHTSELQSRENLVCRLLLEKKKDSQGWYR